jgi:hypothetical protein
MNDYVNEQMSLLEKTIEKTRVNVKASPKKRMSKIINLSIAKYKPPRNALIRESGCVKQSGKQATR